MKYTFATIIVLLAIFILSCSPTKPDPEPFDWAIPPTVRFVTMDWEYPQSLYHVGDSISVAYSGKYVVMDPDIENTNKIAIITTASGDTESVEIFDKYIPTSKVLSIFIDFGTKILSQRSENSIPENGILEIESYIEEITVTFQPYIYKSHVTYLPLILRDKSNVKK